MENMKYIFNVLTIKITLHHSEELKFKLILFKHLKFKCHRGKNTTELLVFMHT